MAVCGEAGQGHTHTHTQGCLQWSSDSPVVQSARGGNTPHHIQPVSFLSRVYSSVVGGPRAL